VFGWIVLFFVVGAIFAFNRASLIVNTIVFALLLILISVFSQASTTTIAVLWIIWAVLAGILNLKPLRRYLFSEPLLKMYRKNIPHMSVTEKEALAAGTVGWEGEMFSGMPDWNKLREIPKATLTPEEQAFLDGPVEDLCGMVSNWDINHRTFEVPEEIWAHLRKHGFFGLIIPKEYGGKAFSALGHAQVIAKVASVSVAVATVVSVPNSLGPAELLLQYGTKEQKNYYLPRLANGEDIPCFALTSPVAGSDASSIVDSGVVCRGTIDGEEIVGIRLNWDKRYITLSPVATIIGLAFKLYDPDHLLGDHENIGITCALVPSSTPGVIAGRRHFPLCCAFPNGPTQGKDVFIPLDSIIGGKKMAGCGWRMLMESLAAGRSISLPSMAVGGTKRVVFASGAYARIRKQFNVYIGAFGGVQEALARIGGYSFLMEATRLFTITALDRGEQPAVASAISKYNLTNISRSVVNDAMDIHGGKGICMGPNNYLAQTYIESPISITVEGANILTRSMIIFGQGAIRCHPYILKEMQAAQSKDTKEGLIKFDEALFAHLGFIISNKTRAFLLALTRGYLASAPKGELKRYYQRLSRYSAAFALVADVAMLTMGAKLKRKEKLSGRLGDLLSLLYMGSAAIKYYELLKCEEGLPFIRWACDEVLYRLQTQLNGFLLNMPNRWLASILRVIVFPLGRHSNPPGDHLSGEVANYLLYPSKIREHLANHAYVGDSKFNPVRLIESVLEKVIAVEPLEKKLHRAVREQTVTGKNYEEKIANAITANVITSEEAKQLLDAFSARMSIINVDDFAPDELVSKFSEKGEI